MKTRVALIVANVVAWSVGIALFATGFIERAQL